MIGYVNVFTPTASPSPAPTISPSSQSPTAPTTFQPTAAPITLFPSAVPTVEPTMPPTLIHLTLPWSGYSSGYGGCTYSGGVVQYLNAGSMPWKSCVYAASSFGAMLFGSVYTIMPGWGAHRLNSVAEYVSSWNSFTTNSISSSGTCVLGRDPNAGATRDKLCSSSITYENDVWFYQDLGSMYYDQCQNAAGLHGASIITPVSYSVKIFIIFVLFLYFVCICF